MREERAANCTPDDAQVQRDMEMAMRLAAQEDQRQRQGAGAKAPAARPAPVEATAPALSDWTAKVGRPAARDTATPTTVSAPSSWGEDTTGEPKKAAKPAPDPSTLWRKVGAREPAVKRKQGVAQKPKTAYELAQQRALAERVARITRNSNDRQVERRTFREQRAMVFESMYDGGKEAVVDLHGMQGKDVPLLVHESREHARSKFGLRRVRFIVGRGRHSAGGEPVLLPRVVRASRAMGASVLVDGGVVLATWPS